jgi:cell division protein FtsQ
VAAALVTAVGTTATWLVLGTSVLGVRDIVVTGSTIVSAERIRSVAAVALGTPLARVDTDAVAERVTGLPSVAEVDVSRSWPATLDIAVTERKPAAVVRTGQHFLVLDRSGVIFNQVSIRPPGVVALAVASPGPDDPATQAALRVVAALTPTLRRVAKQVVAESPVSIRVDLLDGRSIIWGDADQSEKKAQVATTLLSRAANRIDVSAPDVVAVS